MNIKKQPWLSNMFTDGVFILLPPFLSLLVILMFPSVFRNDNGMPEAWWVLLILLIDVAHVYSTLYRTYFDPSMIKRQKNLLLLIPLLSFIVSVMIYTIGDMLFWRVIAYLAVFHFVRQQYGFMRLYARKEAYNKWHARIDALTIYTATVFPVLHWHLNTPRNFNWFINNDFYFFRSNIMLYAGWAFYIGILLVYFFKEGFTFFRNRSINIPKNAVVAGTVLSWYFGIIYFNGDMAFTLLNVVSHGIPYMCLIWIYGRKNYAVNPEAGKFLRRVFSKYGMVIFLGIIFIMAFIEEGFWDALVWKDHASLFALFDFMRAEVGKKWLSLMVPLLALPQITHYVIDGFIWRMSKSKIDLPD